MDLIKIKLNTKPRYVKLSENIDFFQFFQNVERGSKVCFLLESLGPESYNSRYSIIGFDPDFILEAIGNTLYVGNEKFLTSNPYLALRQVMPAPVIARDYVGGLVGYLSYESMNYFEPTLHLTYETRFPVFQFGVYTDGVIYDKMTGEVFYFYYNQDRSAKISKWLNQKSDFSYDLTIKKLGYTMTKEEHEKGVLAIKEEILAGNTFQCQLGFKCEFEIGGSLLPVYKELRKLNPSPHMYYFKVGKTQILGASPELLFRLHNGEMESYPLAGSIRRGSNEEEDLELARKLLNDPKEIAEHNMLVDLHRNDIGRVARFGTVKVRRLMDVKRYSHIQHISSEVSGIIRPEEDMFSGLASSFPAGTLSGAPKIESMKIIHRVEQKPRGVYGGAIGHFGFNGNCAFAIPIRSLFASGSYAYTQSSGGIVYDSEPEREYNEIRQKSMAIEKVIEKFLN